ncbi:MAG TPA: hypothetical protein GYA08_16675 [Chloroflexi bacterium]|nr:hypothetical protein [Chloroflexota bacterium]
MITKYLLAWLGLPVIGIINGALRQFLYRDALGDLTAHQVSTVTGIVLFGLYIWLLSRWWPLPSAQAAISVGLIWLALTIGFEFIFGHYVMGNSWERLLADYNLLAGRVWVLVLIWITLAPYVFYRLTR